MPSLQTDPETLVDALAQSAFVITAVLNRVGTEHDLSLTQLRVLAILRDRRLRMSELSDFLGLTKSTMSGLVDRAEKRGLLERAPNITDSRATDVLLTACGAQLAGPIFAQISEALTPLISTLGVSDQRRLQHLLTRMLTGS